MADLPTARASDAERDRVVGLLREHCVAGRITLDEFTERMEGALAARTRGDLDEVLTDLPELSANLPVAAGRKRRRWVVAFMSGADTKGRWRAAEHITAVAVMGGCKLDLRGAEIEGAELHITAWAFWGGIDIILPEGIGVEVGGLSVMGGRSVRMKDVPITPGSPRVVVTAFPIMGGVSVRSRGSRLSERLGAVLSGGDLQRGRHHNRNRDRDRDRSAVGHGEPPVSALEPTSDEAARDGAYSGDMNLDGAGTPHLNGARTGVARSPATERATSGASSSLQGAHPLDVTSSGRESLAGEMSGDGTVTILFSDITDYSGLTERLGDRVVQEMLFEHRDMVRSCVALHGGREVKVQGDGFMLAFAGVARALRCAAAIQRSLAKRAVERPERSFSAHMGVHTGEALLDGADYTGHTVIVASRLADVAAPGEVLVSSVVKQLVARSGEFDFGMAREVTLKGLKDLEPAVPFEWDATPV